MEKVRVAREFPLHSTCSSFGIHTLLFPLSVQHLFMRRTTHRQTETHPLRLFFSATASMAQEQSQELPVEQQLSNSTGGDTKVKLSASCYSLINHVRATAHHIQQKIKRSNPTDYCAQITKTKNLKCKSEDEMHRSAQ